MIDTVVLAGLTHPILRSRPPSGPASVAEAEAEWQWIEETLSSSTADWIIVAGHYPGKPVGIAEYMHFIHTTCSVVYC